MKRIFFSLTMFCIFLITSCSAQKRPGKPYKLVRGDTTIQKDSIEYYEIDFIARQKNYIELLIGNWIIDTMRRQSGMEAEPLTGIFLSFNADLSFNGNAGCNHIAGKYTLKGTSIKFSNIIATKMACDKLEQESALLKLLQERVSAYTVDKSKLLLRDGSSNIVFHASRK
ncbi:MAG: META domain-containing protein [Bacteroidota bacterium]|nr:META domain-containing protein [Bacteroidota bacterium]